MHMQEIQNINKICKANKKYQEETKRNKKKNKIRKFSFSIRIFVFIIFFLNKFVK